MANERIILGIDPGTTIMGFGLIRVVSKQMEFMQLNELLLDKYADHYTKLKVIFERTIELIETHHPDEIAIEAPFFGKNVQSMLKLGRAQGVAMAAGLSRQIPITEYEPKKSRWPSPATETPARNKLPRCSSSFWDSRNFQKTSTAPMVLPRPCATSSIPTKSLPGKATQVGMLLLSRMPIVSFK